MRISAQAKEDTRERILAAARRLFVRKGFEVATTREIAERARIAAGTLFNYFPNKEAIVLRLARCAMLAARDEFATHRGEHADLAEALFDHVAIVLRKLDALRPYLYPALGLALSPATPEGTYPDADAIRESHLDTVSGILAGAGVGDEAGPEVLHLYWTLFTGVVAFWVRDKSPHQEITRALLDRSMAMFAGSLLPEDVPRG